MILFNFKDLKDKSYTFTKTTFFSYREKKVWTQPFKRFGLKNACFYCVKKNMF